MKRSAILIAMVLFSYVLNSQEAEPVILSIVPAFPPSMFIGESGEPEGFIVELITMILNDLDVEFEIKVMEFSQIHEKLQSGDVDLFLPMLHSKEREKLFYFSSTSVLSTWGELFVSEETIFNDVSDLIGQKVGIMQDDINGLNFIAFMERLNIPFIPVTYPSYNDLFAAVERGDVFGGVCSNQVIRDKWNIKPTATIFSPSLAYPVTGLQNGDHQLIDEIDIRLRELKENPNSYYYTLIEKWFHPKKTGRLSTRVKRILAIVLGALSLIVIILFAANRFLHREIHRRVSELESQKEEKKKVEVRNEFLSSISHELRTPMNIIVSLAYLLSQTKLDINQQNKIEKISKASQLLINIINNFLDFNRLEQGAINLENRPYSPRDEVSHTLSMFDEEATSKGINLVSDVQETLPEVLWGDPFRIAQILNNLINNSLKFSSKGTITLKVTHKKTEENDCKITYIVQDEGIGIDQDKLSNLFNPFTQADETISRQFGGSGLGLTICKQLANLMGGSIEVRSQKGKGTTFKVTLTCQLGEIQDLSESETNNQLESFRGAKVLFVEDNKVNLEIGKELFEIANLTLTTATNGQEALDLAKKNEYDLILMDIQMPVLDGIGAAKAIREWELAHKKKRVPIVALTAHSRDERTKKDFFVSMDGVASKPISINELNEVFIEWLGDFREMSNQLTRKVKEEIDDIPGIDLNKALMFVGSRALLTWSLEVFIEENRNTSEQLLSLAQNGDRETLKTRIHTLKGTLGYLGFFLFTDMISLEESLLSNKDDFNDKLNTFCTDLNTTIEELDTLHKKQ